MVYRETEKPVHVKYTLTSEEVKEAISEWLVSHGWVDEEEIAGMYQGDSANEFIRVEFERKD